MDVGSVLTMQYLFEQTVDYVYYYNCYHTSAEAVATWAIQFA
jgi:hypothetical protein